MRRRARVGLGVLFATVAGFLIADTVLTSVVERRLSARFSEGLRQPASVELQGWPAVVRLLMGGVPRVEATSSDWPAGVTPIRSLQTTLFDVDLEARTLLDARAPLHLTAARADLDATLRPEHAPLGANRMELILHEITSRLARDGSSDVLTARRAEMVVSDLAFPDSSARLSRLHVTLPELQLTRTASPRDSLVLESPDARFEALLTEAAANTLWTLPGQVTFLADVGRLTIGPLSLDLHVRVVGDQVVLEPQVPPRLQPVVGAFPPVSFRPNLPLGAVIQDVELQPQTLTLRGSSRRLEVPLQSQSRDATSE